VATDLHVSIPTAGLLVTGYALGVAVGAPLMTVGTGRLHRKTVLLALIGLFALGNLICALAPTYAVLMGGRITAALGHGAFFGVGSVVAAALVPPDRRASAIALMFTGLTLANILGVPFGTLVGQLYGWRATFWIITALALLAVLAIQIWVPPVPHEEPPDLRREVVVLQRPQVLLALVTTMLGFGGVFTTFTYIAPILEDVSGFAPSSVTWILLLFGVGLTIGNVLGGRLADRRLMPTLLGGLVFLAVVLVAFGFTSHDQAAAVVTVVLWGMASFVIVPPLQMRILDAAKEAPALASSLNIAAFNVGNAGGAFLGGRVIEAGLSLTDVPWAGALVTLAGLATAALSLAVHPATPRAAPALASGATSERQP
jgi:DHA1 family inner membrane transport protein